MPDSSNMRVLTLPRSFTYNKGFTDLEAVLKWFDWSIEKTGVQIDLSQCEKSNYQALALLIQYAWFLTIKGCDVSFKYGMNSAGPTNMLSKMGAINWHQVLFHDGKNFGNVPDKTLALRRRSDVQSTINTARKAIKNYNVGFPEYLSYIVSELLYNSTEHGSRIATAHGQTLSVPSIFQFGRYPATDRLVFLFSDLGVGMKAHLEQTYPAFPSHQEAMMYALKPEVSGTFRAQQSGNYAQQNNAGMGLTYSHLMLKRLKGDMYIVSHDGLVHVSPEDTTSRLLGSRWPGTFILIMLDVGSAPKVNLDQLIGEIRASAEREVSQRDVEQQEKKYCISIFNYFGKWAEDKDAAIVFRDRQVACPIFCTSGIVSVARFLFHLNSRSRGCGEVASA